MSSFITNNKTAILIELTLAVFCLYVASLFYEYFAELPEFSVFPWEILFHLSDNSISQGQRIIAIGVGGAIFLAFNAMAIINPKQKNAHFASYNELRKANLFTQKGLVLARSHNKLLTTNDHGHVLVAAPTRSGKGVGLVIPNLFNWGASAIVMDIKGENYEITSGFRKQHGQKIYRFAPQDESGNTNKFNPFTFIRFGGKYEIKDLTRLAHHIFPLPEYGDSIWRSEAQSLFIGIALYLHQEPKSKTTLGEIYTFLHENVSLGAYLKDILKRTPQLNPAIVQRFNNYLGKADKEQSGIKSSMNEVLETWAEPLVNDAMAASDFNFEDFRKERSTLYICIGYADLATMAPVLNFMFEIALNTLAEDPFDGTKEHELLILLDEFPSLGNIAIIRKRISDLAGYGIRIMAILQDLNQLEKVYGEKDARTIMSNCHVNIFFAVNDQRTGEYLSKKMGKKTIQRRQKSYRGGTKSFEAPNISIIHEQKSLMTPEEIGTIPSKEIIILKQGCAPIKAKRICYYKDKMFKSLTLPAAKIEKGNKDV